MAEVKVLLDMDRGIEVQREAFLSLAEGRTRTAPNSWLRLPGERRGWLKLLAGYDQATDGLAVKVLARFPENPPGANLGSTILLFDPGNGFPLAVMDGVYITAVRTGAGAALATEALAPSSSSVGMLGTGVVAWYSLLGMTRTCSKIQSVRIYSRSEERRAAFASRARAELGLEAIDVGDVDDAVEGVDVIVTATNSPVPILEERHLSTGVHVNAMGIRTEIHPAATARCLVVADGREEALNDGKFSVALGAGTVAEGDLGPTLGEVLASRGGRAASDRVTMFDSSGVAIQDVACARDVWRRAEESGVGSLIDLGLDGSP